MTEAVQIAALILVAAGGTAVVLVRDPLRQTVVLSFYGGGFAAIPAYLKDLFGGMQVSAIHGRLLTAWSAAGIAGPLIVNSIADHQAAAGREGDDLYSMSLLVMAGLLGVGFIANLLVRPVAKRWHEPAAVPEPTAEAAAVAAAAADAPVLDASRVAPARTALTLLRPRAGAPVLPWILWAVVGTGLAYGLVTTIIRAADLFG